MYTYDSLYIYAIPHYNWSSEVIDLLEIIANIHITTRSQNEYLQMQLI